MIRIVVDKRERRSGIPDILRELGVLVDFRVLNVGDYVVSPECAIERKNATDFVGSVYSGRVFDQAHMLSRTFRFPIIVVEGDVREASRKIRPSVYWGALASISFRFGCAALFTADRRESARLIYTIAKRRTFGKSVGPLIKRARKRGALYEKQLGVLCSIPEIGPKTADRLLRKFGTVQRVITASEAELATVAKIGKRRARTITSVLRASYRPETKERQVPLYLEK